MINCRKLPWIFSLILFSPFFAPFPLSSERPLPSDLFLQRIWVLDLGEALQDLEVRDEQNRPIHLPQARENLRALFLQGAADRLFQGPLYVSEKVLHILQALRLWGQRFSLPFKRLAHRIQEVFSPQLRRWEGAPAYLFLILLPIAASLLSLRFLLEPLCSVQLLPRVLRC